MNNMYQKETILKLLHEIDDCLHDDLTDINNEIADCQKNDVPPRQEDVTMGKTLIGIKYDLDRIKGRIEKAYK